jgi:hypothetical protein
MSFADSLLLATASVMMVVALALAFVPLLPGAVLVWAVALIYGLLNGFTLVTPGALVVITALMIIGSTCDLWLPLLGVQTGGMSCLGALGSLIGGFLATFLIPIPVVGTLVGAVVGALLAELARFRELRKALQAGQSAAKMFVLSYIVELAASIAIAAVFFISLVVDSI